MVGLAPLATTMSTSAVTSSRWFIPLLALMYLQAPSIEARSPNVIVFTADDFYIPAQWEESAPRGVYLEGHHITYGDYPTPKIDAFRDESVIFTHAYASAPKCAPSRFSVLTGRYPSRSEYGVQATLAENDGSYGTNVSIYNSKLALGDSINNVPYVLQNDRDNPYFTGMIGKWHVMADELYTDGPGGVDCTEMLKKAIPVLFNKCTKIVSKQGFDVVDAFYFGNIVTDQFSHNPEWMVSRAQAFMEKALYEEEKPFYMYMATTLTHSPDTLETIRDFTIFDSTKGTLPVDELPDDTYMATREDVRDMALAYTGGEYTMETEYVAEYIWLDEQFGALLEWLRNTPDPEEKGKSLYDTTMIFFINDHGMPAKGMVYEQGSRILTFVRYPPMFGTDSLIVDHMVVSNVDIAATIFSLTGVSPPDDYVLDGISYLEEVADAVEHAKLHDSGDSTESGSARSLAQVGGLDPVDMSNTFPDYNHMSTCCQYRIVEVLNTRSILSPHHQYIFRLEGSVDTEATGGELLYPYTFDQEQFYDLGTDPNCKDNLVRNHEHTETVDMFRRMMKAYISDTCIATHEHGCVKPELSNAVETTAEPTENPTESPVAPVRGGREGNSARGDANDADSDEDNNERGGRGSDNSGSSRGGGGGGGSNSRSGGGGGGGGRGGAELWAVQRQRERAEADKNGVAMNGLVALLSALTLFALLFGCWNRRCCTANEKAVNEAAVSGGQYGAVSSL